MLLKVGEFRSISQVLFSEPLCPRYAESSTDLAYPRPMVLCLCYADSGTERAYMVLPAQAVGRVPARSVPGTAYAFLRYKFGVSGTSLAVLTQRICYECLPYWAAGTLVLGYGHACTEIRVHVYQSMESVTFCENHAIGQAGHPAGTRPLPDPRYSHTMMSCSFARRGHGISLRICYDDIFVFAYPHARGA